MATAHHLEEHRAAVCLDALTERSRRARPMELGPVGSVDGTLTALLDRYVSAFEPARNSLLDTEALFPLAPR